MLVRNYPLSSNGDSTVTVNDDYYLGHVSNITSTGFTDNAFRTNIFYYNSCLPGDRETNPLGPLTGEQWEVRFELVVESFPSSYSSSIININNKNDDSFTIGTGPASSTNININRSIFLEWHNYVITCDGSKIKLYIDGVESGELNKAIVWPTVERKRLLNMPYNQDSRVVIFIDTKISGTTSYLKVRNLSVYMDEVLTTGNTQQEIDIPTPSIPVNSEGLLIYYPLYTDYNNMITGVNTNDFRINNFTHTGGFQASVAQGGYFEGTVASIGFGIPVVDKYTSIYDTYPWMIEFDFCAPTINNKNIVTLTNNVTYGSRTVGVKTGGADTSSMCALSNSDVQTWTHIRIVNKNDRIHVYEDSLKQEFEVRGFYLDSINVNLVFGDGSYTFRLKEVKVYYGYGDDTLERGDYEKEFYGHIYARSATSKTPLILDIPFPYPQFTEMEFFVSSTIDKRLIPDDAYDRIDDNRIYISLPEVQEFNLNTEEEVRFTFCHNKGEYAVNKKEYHVRTKAGVNEYSFPSPFGKIIDMNMRMRVFYDRYLLYPDTEYKYRFDNYTGHIYIMDDTDLGGIKVEDNKRLDVIVFYTGTKSNRTPATLPMSGYIYLKKHKIDRNYNKDLMAIFMNGKLMDSEDIIDMSNNIHKFNRDIQTRYNLEIKSMSPKVHELIPFYKKNCSIQTIPEQSMSKEFECIMTVFEESEPHNRQWILYSDLNPITYHSIIPEHTDYWITLMQHGTEEGELNQNVNYTVEFFRSDYTVEPEEVSVIGQIRLQGNDEEYVMNSPTALLIGKFGPSLGSNFSDHVMFSVQASAIEKADTFSQNKDADGVLVRLQIEPFDEKDHPVKVYYEMTTSAYEDDNYVNVFEWVISTKANGEGEVYYRKTIPLYPDNNPYDNRY